MTTEHSGDERNYYTDQELSDLLGISVGRLRNKITAGSPLPPRIEPPDCRHRLWPRAAVHEWLEQFTVTAATHASQHKPPGRRGRPTKKETRARRA